MESSRDDFVIALRSAFLKKGTQQRFSLLSLIFFSIIFLILGSFNFKIINYVKIGINEIVYRSSFIVSVPENLLKDSYLTIQNHNKLYKENENIKSELEILKAKDLLNEFIILENQRLKNIVDDYLVKSDTIIAKVLSDKGSPFLRSIIINKGSKHKINLGMVVMDGAYLVGKVVEVNYLSSRVLLLSDLNSKIPVIVEPNAVFSILSGTGKDYGIIQYSKKYEDIKNESIIYTSGAGSLFKAGIPIGRMNINNLSDEKKVEFFSDFSQLKFVKVVSFKKVRINDRVKNKNFIKIILSKVPIILLFVSVLNDFDFNHLSLKYFSFNFSYILIFYYSLKKSESLGYTYIFIAGLFNDVVIGTPIGLSSLIYLILCVAASYLRNITLRPSLLKDCIFFLFTILIINSLLFLSLKFIFNYELNYFDQIINITFTFLFYFLFSNLFDFFESYFVSRNNAG